MAKDLFTPYERIDEIFQRAFELSPADETELVWLERRHGRASSDPAAPAYLEPSRLTVLVRVALGGRVGWHRTESGGHGDVEIALRQALALATTKTKARRLPVLPTPGESLDFGAPLFDPEIAGLTVDKARRRAQDLCRGGFGAAGMTGQGNGNGGSHSGAGEEAILRWGQTQIAVANTHGLARMAEATEASLQFRSGRGPQAGWAAGSARSLAGLGGPEIVQRARGRVSWLPPAEPPAAERLPLMLSAEAVCELLNVLNIFALAGRAYLDGTSFLARHRNVQVFDRNFHLRDDAGAMPGLPFPFDFEGMSKRPLELITHGKPSLPALSHLQSGEAGLEPTAQSVGGQDALFGNLFLLPGELDEAGLLQAAEGGIYVGWLDRPECYEPNQLRVRALARGVRLIENGRLGAPLPDLVWDESLLHAFARLRGVGRELVVRSMPSTPLGGIAAPSLVLEEANKLDPVREVVEGQTEATALALLPPPAKLTAPIVLSESLRTEEVRFAFDASLEAAEAGADEAAGEIAGESDGGDDSAEDTDSLPMADTIGFFAGALDDPSGGFEPPGEDEQ
jgi:PmbA protein